MSLHHECDSSESLRAARGTRINSPLTSSLAAPSFPAPRSQKTVSNFASNHKPSMTPWAMQPQTRF